MQNFEIIEKSNLAKNLARKKIIQELILAILECRNVQIVALSLPIKTTSKLLSTSRRTQAFFRNLSLITRLLPFYFVILVL